MQHRLYGALLGNKSYGMTFVKTAADARSYYSSDQLSNVFYYQKKEIFTKK